jgi:hypothetical protein
MMYFAYDGFTHAAGKRSFQFRTAGTGESVSIFKIEIDVALFSKNKLSIQEAPLFCLKMLQANATSDERTLETFRAYQVVPEDFRNLNVERARREAELRLRTHTRRPRAAHPQLPSDLFAAKRTHAI